ncbi:MAG: hypothetical protein HW415_2019 [Deltaproteobacteria bacterium]|nr:hypothetical protein [Deltaproteobacteria bacterium]
MALSEKEKEELRSLAKSSSLRDDMRHVALNRRNPIIVNGKVWTWTGCLNSWISTTRLSTTSLSPSSP